MIVHLLHEGSTLCGFGAGMFPGQWPVEHRWTWLQDAKNATCSKCMEVFKKSTAEHGCSEKKSKNRPGCD